MKVSLWIIFTFCLVFVPNSAVAQTKISQLPLVEAGQTGSSDSLPIVYTESSPQETARLLLQDLINIPAFQTEFNTLVPPQSSHTGNCLFTNGSNTYWSICTSQATENANLVFAGPSSGSAAIPTFRSLVGADLPNPSTNSLGGIKAINAVTHEWISSISTSGVPGMSQPACGDLSNAAASCATDATNASNISSGTLSTMRLPSTIDIGLNGTTNGILDIESSVAGGATISVSNGGATSAYNFNLPTTPGVSGQVLTSAGGGSNAMTWSSGGASGSGINILNNYNYNAELGSTTDWTNSGGTFSVTSTAANVANGTYSFSFLAGSSGQTVTSNLTAIPAGLYSQNCLLEFYYKGFDSNMTAEVTDGTNVIASQVLTASSGYTVQDMNFICPSSGSLEMELISTGSSAQGYFDEVHLGSATNLGQVSQAQLVGQIKITGCAGAWSTTSTSMAAFSAQTGCTYTVLSGNGVSAPSTEIPGITFSSLPPGNYILKEEGLIGAIYSSASQGTAYQFTDGTNTANETSYVGNPTSAGNQILVDGIQQTISYSTAQSNVTLQIYGKIFGAGTSANVFGQTATPSVISVYRFPTSSQQSWNPSTAPASWSGSASPLAGTTASTSFADPGSVTGSVTTLGTPRNISCSTASSLVGITCTLPRAGNYQVCYAATMSNSTSGDAVLAQLVDGSGTLIVPSQQGVAAANNQGFPVGTCGTYTASSTSVTFKVQGKVTAGTGTYDVNGFSVTGLDQSMQAPFTVNSVTSTGPGKYHTEYVRFNGSGTIQSQSGSWVSSITYTATGNYALHIVSGEFSARPSCFATVTDQTTGLYCLNSNVYGSNTTTYEEFQCVTGTTGSGAAVNVNVICMGPD